jgi:hypothetical protein
VFQPWRRYVKLSEFLRLRIIFQRLSCFLHSLPHSLSSSFLFQPSLLQASVIGQFVAYPQSLTLTCQVRIASHCHWSVRQLSRHNFCLQGPVTACSPYHSCSSRSRFSRKESLRRHERPVSNRFTEPTRRCLSNPQTDRTIDFNMAAHTQFACTFLYEP